MTVRTLLVNGSRGELTPLMHARVDTDFYQAGWHTARNMVISRYGSMIRAPGTLYRGAVKDPDTHTVFVPFEFNELQVYAVEFGNEYVRFWTRDGRIETGGVPYELASIYKTADLDDIVAAQSGDVLYLFCNGKRPQILRRRGETNWEFADYLPKDGPYLPINATEEYAFVYGTGLATPKMSANTTDGVTVSTGNSSSSAWHAFSRSRGVGVTVSASGSGFIHIDLGAGNEKVVDKYWFTAANNNAVWDSMFTQWELQGSDDNTTWITLDGRDNETGWASVEARYFEFINTRAFRYYRIMFNGGAGYLTTHNTTEVGQIALGQAPADQTPFDFGFSDVSVVNNGNGFTDDDIGRPIRIQGPDGVWRWLEIKSIVGPTMVKVVLHGQPLNDEGIISAFRFGAWSDTSGWPATGRFFEDRLVTAGTDTDPLGVWLSVNGGYDNYRVSTPLVDDDAMAVRMTGGTFSKVKWLAETGSLLVGTGAVLRSVGGRDSASALSPTNIRQRSETTTAASSVQPIEVETVVLFIDRYRQRLFEAAYTYESDGYLTRELSILGEHLFGVRVKKMAWLDTPHKIAVCLRDDGLLIAFSYDREQKIAGATLIDVVDPVDDIMALPGPQGTDLFLIVNRVNVGRTVEVMAPFWRKDFDTGLPVYGAASAVYEGAPSSTVGGLTWLADCEVGIWADGRDIGDAVVGLDGVVTLPYEIEGSQIVVGRRMPWKLQTLRIANFGQQDGAAMGRNVRTVSASVDLFETAGVRIGTPSQVDTLRFEDEAEENPDAPVKLRTQSCNAPVDDSWQNRGVVILEGDKMYPVTVRGISLNVDGEP